MKSLSKALLITAGTVAATSLYAATYTWQTTGATDNWNGTDNNWYIGAGTTPSPWSDGNDAVFSGTGETVTAGTVSATSLTFGGSGYTITGGTITLGGAHTLAVTNAPDTATIASVLSGSAGLAYSGAGTLTLSGPNTYTGQTTIASGTVRLGNATALGATGAGNETLVASGGTLDLNGTAVSSTEIIRIAGAGNGGAGALVNNGVAQQNALNNLTLTADATIGGTGRFDIRTGTSPSLDLAGYTLTKAGANQVSLVGTSVTAGNIVVNAGTLSIETSSTVQGAGTLTVNNGGTLAFYGTTAANITRAIVSNGGAIANTGASASVNSAISLASGTTTLGGATSGVVTTFGGVISGSGAAVKTGADTVAISAQSTFTGGTTVNGGILDLTGGGGASGTIRGTATINTGGTLRLSTGDATGYNTGSGSLTTINLAGGTLNVNTTSNQTLGSAVINMTGGAITGIAGSNIDLFAGASAINTLASSTTSTISGTSLSLRQNNSTFTVAQGTTASGIDLLVNSVIGQKTDQGNQSLVKAGAGRMALAGANNYTGSTSVNAGTLQLTATGTLANSAVTVAGGATLMIDSAGKTLKALTLAEGSTLTIAGVAGQTTTVTNALTLGSGTNFTVNIQGISGVITTGTTINLLTAGSVSGTAGSITTAILNSRITGSTQVSGNNLVFTAASGSASLVWNNASADSLWNTSSLNFNNNSANDRFYDYDSVLFDDTSGASAKSVALVGTLSPASVTVDNSAAGNFTFAGSGTLSGNTSLTKTGAGTLTLGSTNAYAYAGGTTINGGMISLGTGGTGADTSSAGALGAGAVTVNTGATLRLWIQNSNTYTIANAITLNGGTLLGQDGRYNVTGALTVGAGGGTLKSTYGGKTLTLSGGLSGSGALTLDAPDQVVFTRNNTTNYSGNVSVSRGALTFNMNPGNGGAYTFTTGTLTMGSGTILNLTQSEANGYGSAITFTPGSAITLNGATVYAAGTVGAMLMKIAAPLTLSGTNTFNGSTYSFDGNGNGTAGNSGYAQFLDLGGTVSGTGILNLNRQSTESYIRLSGDMSGYSGAVNVGGGSATGHVVFGGSAGWGSGALTLSGTNASAVIGDVAPTSINGGWTNGFTPGLTSGTVVATGAVTVGAGA